ncbi:hypothetical protein DYB31_011899 [Aphanomyces astaci]|uniref:Uncharacterized protein n=1 Tax=Aphanomyces astaci TaxID=112090 RepID=A0A397EHK7_APHAT|nr:hypothetical protein DYB31_011899 [Aphanomyces astaci]
MGRREVWASYDDDATPVVAKSTTTTSAEAVQPRKPFNLELLRNKVIFGGLVGSTTGATFGFGAFFLAYQGLKTTIEQLRGEEDFLNAGAAVAVAGLPFYRTITFRSHMGYAGLLVALDYFHEEMNNFRK